MMGDGRAEMGAVTVLLLAIRPITWVGSYFTVGPAFGVNLGWLAGRLGGGAAASQWLLFDVVGYVAILVMTITAAIRGRVVVAARTCVVTTAFYAATVAIGGMVLVSRDDSEAGVIKPVLAILAGNALIVLLASRAIKKSARVGTSA
jgi:hypothetical protein